MQSSPTRILIAGGGFGGIRAALDLSHKHLPNTEITLISDKHHFEYMPAFYKLATGTSPKETCIPLSEIFKNTDVKILIDSIVSGDTAQNILIGATGARYTYDYLILGLGSESAFFNIPGVESNALPFKSVTDALMLKKHVHELFDTHAGLTEEELMQHFQIIIIGGGPAGVELAGVLRRHTLELAEQHNLPSRLVTVTVIQAAPRLLPTMPEEVSKRAFHRLDKLGIKILLAKAVTAEDMSGITLGDMQIRAKTIIWTAGVKATSVYEKITGLTLVKGGRIDVDVAMRAKGTENVYVLGDSANTPHAGTAQTALYDGSFVAHSLASIMNNRKMPLYNPRETPYVVPIGQLWAVYTYKKTVLSGWLMWALREVIDLKYFVSILPLGKAWRVWREGSCISETCYTCEVVDQK